MSFYWTSTIFFIIALIMFVFSIVAIGVGIFFLIRYFRNQNIEKRMKK